MMKICHHFAEILNRSHRYEKKTGWLAQCFYLTPAQRIERLNEIYATDKFWENTPEDNRPQAKHK